MTAESVVTDREGCGGRIEVKSNSDARRRARSCSVELRGRGYVAFGNADIL